VKDEEHSLEEKEAQKGKRKPWTLREFGGKAVWDWMGLLIVPIVLSLVTVVFTWQQESRQQRIENQRAQQAQKIENQRAEAERELAEQQAQDEALQAYLDQMSQLMLERKLLEAEEGDPVYTLAQARTSTVILRLDAEHNESVTRFLIFSGLGVRGKASPRLLSRITWSHAALSDATLFNADLNYADLREADLSRASLAQADLSRAYLLKADLSGANLSGANLRGTKLGEADLSGADLYYADLEKADLEKADLEKADLEKADLEKADLNYADLEKAEGITNEELDRQADTLKGATMPNGQKYEDWIKDKEGSG
jgi:uncharacterized protein YjbI with pentapeptide repeats